MCLCHICDYMYVSYIYMYIFREFCQLMVRYIIEHAFKLYRQAGRKLFVAYIETGCSTVSKFILKVLQDPLY